MKQLTHGACVMVILILGGFYGFAYLLHMEASDIARGVMVIALITAFVLTICSKAGFGGAIFLAASSATTAVLTVITATGSATLIAPQTLTVTAGVLAIITMLFAVGAAFAIDHKYVTGLSGKQCLPLFAILPVSVGGSIYLFAINMPIVSAIFSLLTITLIYFVGMRLARKSHGKLEAPNQG